ncbi:uncharacterized protein S100141_01893 [Bacillus licheniformis]|nr:uncharacterized protein S100141_01893 [Bacillus licheniformis]
MGKIKFKLTVLLVLAAVLAGGFYYLKNGSVQDVSTALSQTVSSEEKNYTIYQYKITKIDGLNTTGYQITERRSFSMRKILTRICPTLKKETK